MFSKKTKKNDKSCEDFVAFLENSKFKQQQNHNFLPLNTYW